MRWNEGTVTARITIALALLVAGFVAIGIAIALWRGAASAHAASQTRFEGAKEQLKAANEEILTLEQAYSRSEDSLREARDEISGWEARFKDRVKAEVLLQVEKAKTHWLAIGYGRGERHGFKAGRREGYAAGKDDGYAAALVGTSSSGGAGGGGSGNGCNVNYSGCLKADASDYDCAGGSGDGPYYTGTVQILGYDEYDLDRDGDGIGCD